MKEKEEALPENLRCNRTDGRQWRCNRRVLDDKKLCEIHYLQGRHRQNKQRVPESLKLERKTNKPRNQNSEHHHDKIRAKRREKIVKAAKETIKRKRSIGEALDETVRKMKLKRGDLQLELIRDFLKRQVEKKKEKELEEESRKKEMMKELPNGLMAIPPSPSSQKCSNAGPYNIKLGLNTSCLQSRCFRSKNIEPLPTSTMQILPSVRDALKLRRGKRKKCHWCRRSNYRRLIKCTSCRKQFFCMDCIGDRCFDEQEVKTACPICRGICRCGTCSINQSKDVKHKDSYKDTKKVDNIQQLHYLIHILLPVLEQLNRDQSTELEIEAKITGKAPFEMQIQQAELGCKKLHCCYNCKTSIVDFHRSCTRCSYNLCLCCCLEFRRGHLRGGIKENKFMHPNGRRACASDSKLPSRKKQIKTSRSGSSSISLSSPTLMRNWKVCEDGRISCPPKTFGGCGDSILDLRCVFSFGWTQGLEASVEEIVDKYDFPETSDITSCCSQCKGVDHKANGIKLLQEVARRDDSVDNFLYYPTIQDLHDESLEHFQKHWGKGHPVIIQNVIQGEPNLNWDPVLLFCSYLGKRNSKSQTDKETIKPTNCLDWCEVEIGNKQIFMGSLEGQSHAYVCRETVKLKGWLSSHLFQEYFPAHYAEIMDTLPLKEYINPSCGLLNLAVKLPKEMPKPDTGPCLYIAYGGPEEFMQTDFLTRLSYDSFDVVNILAHATDAPISTEELSRLKNLIKKYKAQDHQESMAKATDQHLVNDVEVKSSLHGEDTEEVMKKSSLHCEDAENMIGKPSLHSEVTEESVLQYAAAEDLHLSDRIAKVFSYSSDSHRGAALSVRDQNISNGTEHGPEVDSEASILLSGTPHKFEDSEDENFFQDDIESSSFNEQKLVADSCGAQWDIFRRQDVPKLLEYLRAHSKELSQAYCTLNHVVHPILDQSFFLDAYHKIRLKEEFNIEPWTFNQKVGEAVIIPAGCPYQVRKLKSCVNVVLEFISPENATECIKLTDELHLLPLRHKAKGKIREVKKMAIHSISAAVEEIRNLKHPKC